MHATLQRPVGARAPCCRLMLSFGHLRSPHRELRKSRAPRSVCVCDNVTRVRTGFGSHTCSLGQCSAKCVNTLGTFHTLRFEKHLQASGPVSHTASQVRGLLSLSHTQQRIYMPLYRGPRPRPQALVNSPHIAQPYPESHTNTVIRPHTSSCGDTAARTPSHTGSP